MTTLENLYYGNIAPHEYVVVRGSEYDITAKLVIRHGERDAFRRGFSLAVRLMVEAMSSEKT